MKKLLCILALCAGFHSVAQKKLSKDYTYAISAPYKVFDAKKKFYFSKGNESLAIKFDGEDILIQKFDNEKPAFTKEQKYEKQFPKNYGLEDVLEVNDKFYVFFSSWDGDKDKEQMFYQEIDFAKGEFVGKPVLMFQVNGKVSKKEPKQPIVASGFGGFGAMAESFGAGDKFDVFRSYDKKNILVQYRRKPEVKNDKKSYDIIGLGAFDANMNKVSVKEITMPYTERRMNNLDYKLDNRGNLYMLTKVFHDDSNDDKKKKKDTVANYHIELFRIKAGSDKIEISQFENNNKFITGLWMFDTSKDYLVCGGFYSNGKGALNKDVNWAWGRWASTGESDGVFVFKIKPDGTMYDHQYHEIPVETLNMFEKSRTAKKNEKKEAKGISAKMPYLVLKDIEVLEDGSMMLVGEQYHLETHSNGKHTYYTFHYEDILATKVAADGSLSFMRKIPKNQIGKVGKGGMSYKYYFANNNHYFVYLDNVKNIDLDLTKPPAKHTDGAGGYLTCVRMDDAEGNVKKGSILNAREVEDYKIYQFSTDRIVETGDNTFMVEAYKKGKEDIMIKATLNN